MRFGGKVAIVTGGGRGIGEAIAVRLAQEGAKVVVVDKNEDTLTNTVEGIKESGDQAVAIVADVTRGEEVRRMVKTAIEQFGKIDILVNNVGLFITEPFLDTGEETWDMILAINLKSTLVCCQAVLEDMTKRGGGTIVNLSSNAGKMGVGYQASYSAAKAGVMGLTKSLAREMARHNINVNCVCPGLVDTELTTEAIGGIPEMREKLVKAIPFRRMAQPEEVAAAVCFLASDDAGFITGQTLSVDGGNSMC